MKQYTTGPDTIKQDIPSILPEKEGGEREYTSIEIIQENKEKEGEEE